MRAVRLLLATQLVYLWKIMSQGMWPQPSTQDIGQLFFPDHLDYMQNIAGAKFVKFHTHVYDKKKHR